MIWFYYCEKIQNIFLRSEYSITKSCVYTTFHIYDRISNSFIDICLIFSFSMKNTKIFYLNKKGKNSNCAKCATAMNSTKPCEEKNFWIHRTTFLKMIKLQSNMAIRNFLVALKFSLIPKVPYPYEVNGKLVTGKGSLIPICSLSNHSLFPSLTVLLFE